MKFDISSSVYYSVYMSTTKYKRINITLPEATIAYLDSKTEKRGRSAFINDAIRNFSRQQQKEMINQQLRKEALYMSNDPELQSLLQDYDAIDNQTWPE